MKSLFRTMFPDSTIDTMSETKIKYVLEFGVARTINRGHAKSAIHLHVRWDHNFASQKTIWWLRAKLIKAIQKNCESLCWLALFGSLHVRGSEGPFLWIRPEIAMERSVPNAYQHGRAKCKHKIPQNIRNWVTHSPRKNYSEHRHLQFAPGSHSLWKKGMKRLRVNLDKLSQDLHFFFKCSSARRQDYKLCEMETDLETQNMLRHVSSRWLSLKTILSPIFAQREKFWPWPIFMANLLLWFQIFWKTPEFIQNNRKMLSAT